MAKVKHVTDPVATGKRIAALRAERGLSQRDVGAIGCNYALVSRIEAGQRTPSWAVLEHLAGRLGTTAEYLATGEKPAMQRGLEAAGLQLHELTDHERAILDQALELELEHTAQIVGEAIAENRAETAKIVEATTNGGTT